MFRRVVFCLLLVGLTWCGGLIADRERLNEELVRLHIVGASDTGEMVPLVRDAILESLIRELRNVTDVEQAKDYLRENLTKIQEIGASALESAGYSDSVRAELVEEGFDTRAYDTFSLPAGVYDALRITIGRGDGENWWCVVFPTVCGGTEEAVERGAEPAGFPHGLWGVLTGEDGYGLRFFLLDVLGKLEKLLQG